MKSRGIRQPPDAPAFLLQRKKYPRKQHLEGSQGCFRGIAVLQNVNVFRIEGQAAAFAHLIDPLVLGVGVGELDQGIAYLHMVVLIGTKQDSTTLQGRPPVSSSAAASGRRTMV